MIFSEFQGFDEWVRLASPAEGTIYVKLYNGQLTGRGNTSTMLPVSEFSDPEEVIQSVRTMLAGVNRGVITITISDRSSGGNPHKRFMKFAGGTVKEATVAGVGANTIQGQLGQLAQMNAVMEQFREQGRRDVEAKIEADERWYEMLAKQEKKIERLEAKQGIGSMLLGAFLDDKEAFMASVGQAVVMGAKTLAMIKNPQIANLQGMPPPTTTPGTTVSSADLEETEPIQTATTEPTEMDDNKLPVLEALNDDQYSAVSDNIDILMTRVPDWTVVEVLEAVNNMLEKNPMATGMLGQFKKQ